MFEEALVGTVTVTVTVSQRGINQRLVRMYEEALSHCVAIGRCDRPLSCDGPSRSPAELEEKKGSPAGVVYRARAPVLGSWEDRPPAA
eukprot:5799843-Pyramimonas_sp.AAC.1